MDCIEKMVAWLNPGMDNNLLIGRQNPQNIVLDSMNSLNVVI